MLLVWGLPWRPHTALGDGRETREQEPGSIDVRMEHISLSTLVCYKKEKEASLSCWDSNNHISRSQSSLHNVPLKWKTQTGPTIALSRRATSGPHPDRCTEPGYSHRWEAPKPNLVATHATSQVSHFPASCLLGLLPDPSASAIKA